MSRPRVLTTPYVAYLGERAGRFQGLLTPAWLYVEYPETDEQELYALAADPYQLDNVAAEAEPAFLALLAERVAALANCAGAECRRHEDWSIDRDSRRMSMAK